MKVVKVRFAYVVKPLTGEVVKVCSGPKSNERSEPVGSPVTVKVVKVCFAYVVKPFTSEVVKVCSRPYRDVWFNFNPTQG